MALKRPFLGKQLQLKKIKLIVIQAVLNANNVMSIENYRPISIISPIAKAFESILGANIRAHMKTNDLLHQDQHGFRERRSCYLALTIVDYCKMNLDKKNVIAIFLDLSKAFDTVKHELLIMKLKQYGFSNDSFDLIKYYLTERYSIIHFDHCKSKKEQLRTGVPQESILGPLLFIIFINDLCHLKLNSNITIFADDTTLYLADTNIRKVTENLESDLEKISKWLQHNRLL